MEHLSCRVRIVDIIAPYRLAVAFDDGTAQTIDFLPVLRGEMYSPLRDLRLFNRVAIDPEAHTLVWPNDADFDPATLHDWPRHKQDFIRMASRWPTPVEG